MIEPSARKPVGIALILLLIAVWAAVVVALGTTIARLPLLLQALVYLVLGIVWILPLKPLLQWMETGRWR